MLSWTNLRWYIYWKWYKWKISGPIWGTMWIGTDDNGWCHELIWGAMLIGTDDKGCCHDIMLSDTLFRKDVTKIFDDQLEWICDWNSCEAMLSWPNLRCYVDWKGCEIKFTRPNFVTMWIGTDVKGCCHDQIWGSMGNWTDDKGCCYDSVWGSMWIKVCERKLSRPIWDIIRIWTDMAAFSNALIWGDLWIWTDVKECCQDLNWSAL
jgi:hypothetical protein